MDMYVVPTNLPNHADIITRGRDKQYHKPLMSLEKVRSKFKDMILQDYIA